MRMRMMILIGSVRSKVCGRKSNQSTAQHHTVELTDWEREREREKIVRLQRKRGHGALFFCFTKRKGLPTIRGKTDEERMLCIDKERQYIRQRQTVSNAFSYPISSVCVCVCVVFVFVFVFALCCVVLVLEQA